MYRAEQFSDWSRPIAMPAERMERSGTGSRSRCGSLARDNTQVFCPQTIVLSPATSTQLPEFSLRRPLRQVTADKSRASAVRIPCLLDRVRSA